MSMEKSNLSYVNQLTGSKRVVCPQRQAAEGRDLSVVILTGDRAVDAFSLTLCSLLLSMLYDFLLQGSENTVPRNGQGLRVFIGETTPDDSVAENKAEKAVLIVTKMKKVWNGIIGERLLVHSKDQSTRRSIYRMKPTMIQGREGLSWLPI